MTSCVFHKLCQSEFLKTFARLDSEVGSGFVGRWCFCTILKKIHLHTKVISLLIYTFFVIKFSTPADRSFFDHVSLTIGVRVFSHLSLLLSKQLNC